MQNSEQQRSPRIQPVDNLNLERCQAWKTTKHTVETEAVLELIFEETNSNVKSHVRMPNPPFDKATMNMIRTFAHSGTVVNDKGSDIFIISHVESCLVSVERKVGEKLIAIEQNYDESEVQPKIRSFASSRQRKCQVPKPKADKTLPILHTR